MPLNQRCSQPRSVSSLTNREVFSCLRNWSDDVGKTSLRDLGNLFQVDGPAIAKLLDWVIDVRVQGTTKWPRATIHTWSDQWLRLRVMYIITCVGETSYISHIFRNMCVAITLMCCFHIRTGLALMIWWHLVAWPNSRVCRSWRNFGSFYVSSKQMEVRQSLLAAFPTSIDDSSVYIFISPGIVLYHTLKWGSPSVKGGWPHPAEKMRLSISRRCRDCLGYECDLFSLITIFLLFRFGT